MIILAGWSQQLHRLPAEAEAAAAAMAAQTSVCAAVPFSLQHISPTLHHECPCDELGSELDSDADTVIGMTAAQRKRADAAGVYIMTRHL